MITELLIKILPSRDAYAHCDVPCGIYDPKPAQIAAATMQRMTKGLIEADKEGDKSANGLNKMTRLIMTKEEHGRILKYELSALWSDYFKPEHLEKYPDLHDTFWKTLKQASTVKQTVDLASAEELVKMVDRIAEIFAETKKT